MGVIDEVRSRVDIAELIGQKVALQKSGKNFRGVCPFHNDRSPSFYVYPEDWSFHCFGCNAHGNGFDFIMRTENLEFGEALRSLADKAGVTLPARSRLLTEPDENDRLRQAVSAAGDYFHQMLSGSTPGRGAREYLRHRGLTEQTVQAFKLGYSPDSWEATSRHLQERGFSLAELAGAGLVGQKDDGRTYDRFRNRLMFPIHDREGRAIGFGARALDDSQPKYLNSPQTALFDKSATLFALHMARASIRGQDRVVLVEGYMDAIMAHQYEIRNVVATLGTALSKEHIQTLKRLTKNLVLALDPDSAGDEATIRGLQVATEVMDRRLVPVPTWRGLVRYEYTLDANLRVMALPPGQDPDEVIRSDPARWQVLVDEARPLVDYLFSAHTAQLNPSEPRDRDLARQRLLPVLREISDPSEQAHYVQRLAMFLGVHENVVWQEVRNRASQVAPRPRPADASRQVPAGSGAALAGDFANRAPSSPNDTLADFAMALLVRFPELLPKLDSLGPDQIPGAHRAQLLSQLRRGLPDETLRAALGPELEEYLDRLLQIRMPNADTAKAQEDWEQCMARLRQFRLRQDVSARGQSVEFGRPGWEDEYAPSEKEAQEIGSIDRRYSGQSRLARGR